MLQLIRNGFRPDRETCDEVLRKGSMMAEAVEDVESS